MFVDFVLNGQGMGPVGEQLSECRFDPGLLRPYIDDDGRKCVTVNTGRKKYNEEKKRLEPIYEKRLVSEMKALGVDLPVFNAMSLRKDEWLQMDTAVQLIIRKKLRAWADLAASSSVGGFNAMGKMIYEHETASDPGAAVVDMDGLADDQNDSPKYQLEGLPLPITHSGFWLSSRRLMISRNSGTPLNTFLAEACGRRVAEMIEKTTIGVETGITYGASTGYSRTSKVYGYTNFGPRITKTDMTAPTGSNGTTILSDWLALRELLYAAGFTGPFMVYTSNDWDQYLDNLFSTTEPSAGTLRSRLLQVDGIQGIRRLDYLTNTFTVLMVQMTSEVAQAINGMAPTLIQWESQGGLRLNFKIMAIQVPLLRADFDGNCGIAHGTTS